MLKFLKPKKFRTREQEYHYWINVPIFHPRILFDFGHRGFKSQCLNSRDEYLLVILIQSIFLLIFALINIVWFGLAVSVIIKAMYENVQIQFWIPLSMLIISIMNYKVQKKLDEKP